MYIYPLPDCHYAYPKAEGVHLWNGTFWMSYKLMNKTYYYYMAVSHKDWELLNSQIWLANIDINPDIDFSTYNGK